MTNLKRLSLTDATELVRRACLGAGASPQAALALAWATVSAEAHGVASVGFRHLIDYLQSLREGRIDGGATPVVSSPAPALMQCDARGGIGQLGFDQAFDDLAGRARTFGVALFTQRNSYTTGELGYYVRRLAEAGLAAFAATNGPPLLAPPGSAKPVYCTNPLAFAAPRRDAPPLLIDQSSSATAFVNIRNAAALGQSIPPGWAIDAEGLPTTDAREAVKGALLTFGGERGANIALMVEVLAAGLSGANWSTDAPNSIAGERSPGVGLVVIALNPTLLDPDFSERLDSHLQRLAALGVHIPGARKGVTAREAEISGVSLPLDLLERIEAFSRPL
jgi:(2R)-3-sulfolactate dehydrogenase (NADP+)